MEETADSGYMRVRRNRSRRERARSRRETERSGRETERYERETERSGRETERSGREAEISGRETERHGRETERPGRETERYGREAEIYGRETARYRLRVTMQVSSRAGPWRVEDHEESSLRVRCIREGANRHRINMSFQGGPEVEVRTDISTRQAGEIFYTPFQVGVYITTPAEPMDTEPMPFADRRRLHKTAVPQKLIDEREACSVCLGTFKAGQRAYDIPCHHVFHSKCLRTWLLKSQRCPLCRKDIFPEPPVDESGRNIDTAFS